MTKSFVNEWKDASIFLKEYFATKKPYIFNSFVLPGTAPTKEKEEWKADRKAIKYLFSYWLMNKKNNAFDYEYKQGYEWLKETFDSLENFMNIKDSDANAWKKQTYNTLLTDKETFSLDSSTNYGSTGITSGLSLFGKDNLDLGLSLLEKAFSSVDAANIKEIDLFGELKKIANEMVNDLGGTVSPTFDYTDKNKEEANKKAALEYGQKIEEAINPLKSDSKPKYDDDKYKENIINSVKKAYFTKKFLLDEIQRSINIIENEKDFSIEGKEKSDYSIYYKYLNGIFNILEEDSLQYFKNNTNKPNKIEKELLDRIYIGGNIHTSISRLEKYAECPFSYH